MSSDTSGNEPKKGRSSALPWLVGFAVLAGVVVVYRETILSNVIYMYEQREIKRWADDFNSKSRNDAAQSANAPAGAGGETARGKQPMSADGGGGGGGGGRGSGRGPMTREQMEERFKQADADSNGKLEGDEISERMKPRVADIDTDKDTAISLEEFVAALQARANARPAGETPSGDTPASGTETPPPAEPKPADSASEPKDNAPTEPPADPK